MPLYEEIVPAGKFVKLLVGGMGAFLFLFAFAPGLQQEEAGWWIVLTLTTLVLLAGFYWNFRRIQIVLTPQEFRARYGLFNNKVIPVKDILSWEVTTGSFRRYAGIGVRWGSDGSWAYTTSFGPAVRFNLSHGRPFVVSSNRPQELCRALSVVKRTSA